MSELAVIVVILIVFLVVPVITKVIREHLLPTSGYEPPYAPLKWNLPPMVLNHNCYDYAFNHYNILQRDTSQPGELPNSIRDKLGSQYTCALTNSRLVSDHHSQHDLIHANRDTVCPVNSYKIALVMDLNDDYHFLRQNTDGTWSHKPGQGLVTNKDFSGNVISDPETANMNSGDYNYDRFCSYFCVSTDAHKNFR